jgi:hypothetical protein
LIGVPLLYFSPPPLCNFVSSEDWDGWGDVHGVAAIDLSPVAAGDDWGVSVFVLFDLARRQG